MNDSESNERKLKFYRRPTFWWVVLMVICVVTTYVNFNNGGPDLMEIVFFSSCVAIFTSIGVWLAVGTGWWRFLVQFAASLILVLLITSDGPQQLGYFLLMCLFGAVVIGVVAFPIFLFRMLRNGSLAKPSPHEVSVKEVLQFGVVHLLVLATGVAVLISLGQWLLPLVQNQEETLSIVCTLGVTLSLGSLVAIWATLGNRPGTRTAVSALAMCAICGLNYSLIDVPSFAWVYALLTFVVWIQITLLMWCMRFEGFRFITCPRTGSS